MCKQESSSDNSTKMYTRKYLVIIETTISDFRTSFYISAIKNLAFHLTPVHILGTNDCGTMQRTAFEQCELFQDIPFCRDYDERVVTRFSHQIKLESYGGNRSVSIEGIAFENFSAFTKTYMNSTTPSNQRHKVFHSFLI